MRNQMRGGDGEGGSGGKRQPQVVDGSEIMELVENKEVFSEFVDDRFQKLDRDGDGKLSVKELQPAVSDIGAALGLPPKGSSANSDHIYSEVMNEFTHGKDDTVSKIEFKEVLSDILLGVAAGLKRDPIVILRMDGQDLLDFMNSPSFEMEMIAILNKFDRSEGSLQQYITDALEQLTVDQGMPPTSDPWVKMNIIESSLRICSMHDHERPISDDTFLREFKKVAECIARHLEDQPVIVAHTENTFDGNGIKQLLSNKFQLDKLLDAAVKEIPKDRHQKLPKDYFRVALDTMAPAAGLPPFGAIDQMDQVVKEVFTMVKADEGQLVEEEEFKKVMVEILASLMLQLQGNPISVSSNSVVHEPLSFSSSFLLPKTSS